MEKKKRPSIGIMIGGAHSSFPAGMIQGISQKAAEADVNVFFFPRIHTRSFFRRILGETNNNIYDYQFNTIYDYCKLSGTDGVIISYGTIGFHLNQDNASSFAARYNNRPLVIVTEKVELPNCHCIISDNRQGMFDTVSHLIRQHSCRKILFMQGPQGNTDAGERYLGYMDAMVRNNLPVTESMVARGDFSAYVDAEVEWLLDHNPDADAIAFANDEMATAAYQVCARRGIRIGEDLKVTGYDGSSLVEKLTPPLTSVFQDANGMGRQAVEDMLRILDGDYLSETRYPVHLVARDSCGCIHSEASENTTPANLEEELNRYRQQIARQEAEFAEYQGKSWFIPMMARELNDNVSSPTDFFHRTMETLQQLKTDAAYLFLLEHPIDYDGISEWNCPDNLHLTASLQGSTIRTYSIEDAPLVTEDYGIAQITDDGKAHQFTVFLLYSGSRQYGLLACDIPVDAQNFYYVVSLQLGLSLRYFEMSMNEATQRRKMLADMERMQSRNKELDMISGYDQLTGLLNLRGLNEKVRRICADGIPHPAYVIYCDMDHLKEINDTWGHQEGNSALRICADNLQRSVRDSDIVARLGGDEFICLVITDTDSFPAIFQNRVERVMHARNTALEKPYYVDMSYGIQPVSLRTPEDFQAAMNMADKLLYQAKKNRRSSAKKTD